MDIRFRTEEGFFGTRAACIIYSKDKKKILVHKEEGFKHIALPGGGVMFNEKSEDTIKRELIEETGYEITNTKFIAGMENFYNYNNENVHGIEFYYTADFASSDPYTKEKIQGIEERGDKGKLEFCWIDIDKLDEHNLKPNKIRNIIKERKNEPVHIVSEE